MAFELPSKEMLRRMGADLGMDITDEYAAEFLAFAQNFVPDFRVVERLADEALPVKYPRTPGYRPEPKDNRHGAWFVRTTIKGAASGKLHGRRLAIKDNVSIASVPMMNG
ncbi:MAG TPA: amidase, partial [Burkholderiaceae bacterium]|nr:amidase [Burkholderiaceae bacterium]